MGSIEDVSRIIGMGHLPGRDGSLLDGDSGSGTPSRPSPAQSRPGSAKRRNPGKPPRPKALPKLAPKQDTLQSQQSQQSQQGQNRLRLQRGSELPVFQLGDRPLLLPPKTASVATSGTGAQRASRLTPRKPGTPRRGTPWHAALRQKRTAPFLGVAPPELELSQLHVGECFGLAALYDPKGECPYVSGCEVRVQSCEARVLVLTNGSLLYLNETLARTLVDRAKERGDPVAPLKQDVKHERTHRSRWMMQKLKVLDRIIMHED